MKQVFVIVGLSGAGRSTALRALEDIGFGAVDNPPLSLLSEIINAMTPDRVAIGLNVEQILSYPGTLEQWLWTVNQQQEPIRLIFLECREDVVVQRFSETRRRHPLSHDGIPLRDAFKREAQLLARIREYAAIVLDTTEFTPHRLREEIQRLTDVPISHAMVLTVMSFGFRNGVPPETDFLFDLRQLRNPHWDPTLRHQTGRSPEVAAFVKADPLYASYIQHIEQLMQMLLPGIIDTGKAYCTIALGCTGGRHRSVSMAEDLAQRLKRIHNPIVVIHTNMQESGS